MGTQLGFMPELGINVLFEVCQTPENLGSKGAVQVTQQVFSNRIQVYLAVDRVRFFHSSKAFDLVGK